MSTILFPILIGRVVFGFYWLVDQIERNLKAETIFATYGTVLSISTESVH